jgi:hypothetical protein
MSISRRQFLASAAVALVRPRLASAAPLQCTVLDLGERCALRESLAGYRMALANATPTRPVLIVPSALEIPRARIHSCLWRGGTVILEAGDLPVELWPRRTPYVELTWPIATTVRDFSKVVPVSGGRGDVIATADGIPVATRRQIGFGTLIFLGTPIGPALWAGDAEAKQWVLAVVSGA